MTQDPLVFASCSFLLSVLLNLLFHGSENNVLAWLVNFRTCWKALTIHVTGPGANTYITRMRKAKRMISSLV